MPEVALHGPWQAVKHGGKNATRWYVMDSKHEIIAVHMQPGIAREIARLPTYVSECHRLASELMLANERAKRYHDALVAISDDSKHAVTIALDALGPVGGASDG